jgi:predicted DNA-binding transcriptional regulator YafY
MSGFNRGAEKMQASRLLSILMLLQLRGRVSAEALAEEFEVSVRTIYRDIDQLSAAGIPVYGERGRSGGFQLAGDYRTQLTGMTPAQADALMLAGAGQAAEALGFGGELAEARLKLLASLPPDAAARADRTASRFHLDTENWYAKDAAARWLGPLAEAVWQERRIEMDYRSWKAAVSRRLDPLGLVLKAGTWYLVAREGRAIRTYRVTNIDALRVTQAEFRRPATFNLARYWAKSARAFEASLVTEMADVALSPLGLTWLRDVNPRAAAAFEAGAGGHTRPGWQRARIPLEASRFARLQWLALGTEAEVLAPPALRRQIAAEAKAAAAQHA